MTTISVQITPSIIRAAGNDCYSCPTALALRGHLNGKPIVRKRCVNLSKELGFAELPEEAVAFIEQWDATGRGEPMAFLLRVPEWWTTGVIP